MQLGKVSHAENVIDVEINDKAIVAEETARREVRVEAAELASAK
jgi:hypothetical protein